jgi:hypothetical protein
VSHSLWSTFVELLVVPFQHASMVWGIVPLYFSWIVNEVTSSKPSFHTAFQTGFGLLWAGANWTWLFFQEHPDAMREVARPRTLHSTSLLAVNVAVTILVLLLGVVALWSGLRRKYPKGMRFIGHTRFSAYFMIAIFPIQSRVLEWSWDRVAAIAVCAVPIWLALHFGLMPLRK